MLFRVLVVLLVASTVLAGCGRRGSLGTPEVTDDPATIEPNSGKSPIDPGSSSTFQGRADFDPVITPTPAPNGKRGFVLDPLL